MKQALSSHGNTRIMHESQRGCRGHEGLDAYKQSSGHGHALVGERVQTIAKFCVTTPSANGTEVMCTSSFRRGGYQGATGGIILQGICTERE